MLTATGLTKFISVDPALRNFGVVVGTVEGCKKFCIQKASFELQKDIASNEEFAKVATGMDRVKKNLGMLTSQGRQFSWSKRYKGPQAEEVNTSYVECLEAYKTGQWQNISKTVVELDKMVKELLFSKQYGKYPQKQE